MNFFLISDNVDTAMGLRLAGIKGVVVHTENEVKDALIHAASCKNIGIILITERLMNLCINWINEWRSSLTQSLVVQIPDRHSTGKLGEVISKYIKESIGIEI
ncbi:MAG: V-type ATP synthase subunit F [Candidatus Improbicoccus devescovinae]|nr:MAG: V-type ATP synthase subunit F [Candidatus Improbicoccus devescovinae]